MTPFDRFDDRFGSRLTDALEDLASPQFPDYFDDVLLEAVAHRQRPAWRFLERWIPMSTLARRSVLVPAVPWRTIGIALLLLALLVATAVVSLGTRRNPAPPFGPAANGVVAYVADADIFTRDLATGEVRLAVGGLRMDVGPMFSRDGLSLAWARLAPLEADGLTIMVSDVDGTDARAVFGPELVDWVAWSPSSESLAVISGDFGERTLSIVPTDGGEPTGIDVPVTPYGNVEWRPPDGRELIFSGVDEGGRHAVFGVRPDGSGFRRISANRTLGSFAGPFEMTPDGNLLLFTNLWETVAINILDLRTGEERLFGAGLPDPPGYDRAGHQHGSPSVLPDGQTIVFGRSWNKDNGRINHQLWAASIEDDGADAVAIGPVHRSRSGYNPFWHSVAPDGRSVLVVENDTLDAWLADPDGGEPRPVDMGEVSDVSRWQDVMSWQRVAP